MGGAFETSVPPVSDTRDTRPAKAATGTKDCATSEMAPAVCTSAANAAADRSDDDDDPVEAPETEARDDDDDA